MQKEISFERMEGLGRREGKEDKKRKNGGKCFEENH